MRIPTEVLEPVWKRKAAAGFVSVREFPDGTAEAFDLWGGPGRGHVVRSDGTVWAWDQDVVRHVAIDDHEAIQGIAIAAKWLPELMQALPARPADARECDACDGHGFVDFGTRARYLVCHSCDGLGWLPNKPLQPTSGARASSNSNNQARRSRLSGKTLGRIKRCQCRLLCSCCSSLSRCPRHHGKVTRRSECSPRPTSRLNVES